jgi:hypothetical protein
VDSTWTRSGYIVLLGIIVRFTLSQVNETLGTWVGVSIVVFGSLGYPAVVWFRSRRRAPETSPDDIA